MRRQFIRLVHSSCQYRWCAIDIFESICINREKKHVSLLFIRLGCFFLEQKLFFNSSILMTVGFTQEEESTEQTFSGSE